MTELSQETQIILAMLKKIATDTLERKRRLDEYAVVWQDSKPIAIGDDAPVHFKTIEDNP